MLQALIHNKVDGDGWGEDLLTSVVLGSASYLPERALLPFLSEAISLEGERLASKLEGMRVHEVHFWPRIPGGWEPDALIELRDTYGECRLLIVEAKLGSGKSSHPSTTGPVTDQLGKYWLSLSERNAWSAALAVVYLTADIAMPRSALEATQHELHTKSKQEAPLYWLSWRRFDTAVRHEGSPLLRDCVKLLHDRWGLVHPVVTPPPAPPPLPAPWRFRGASSSEDVA